MAAVKVRTKKASDKKPAKKKQPARLTTSELSTLTKGCIAPGKETCPVVSGKDSPYQYQQGCRAEGCKLANRRYYKAWRDEKAEREAKEKAAKARKRAAAKKSAPPAKKVAAKKTARKSTKK